MKRFFIPCLVGGIAIYAINPGFALERKILNTSELLAAAEKIVELFKSPTAIDLDTGCGHRNYSEIGTSGGVFYPDGIERSAPGGDLQLLQRVGIGYPTWHSVQYWNDWLGLSDDLEEALEEAANDFYERRITQPAADLKLTDAELLDKYASWDKSAEEIRSDFEQSLEYWTESRENTRPTFSGFPLLFPEQEGRALMLSERVDDVGYWDFAAAGGNAVRGGYDWEFWSDSEGLEAYFHDGLLDVPLTPAGEGWGITGSVDLRPRQTVDRSLERQSFTLAFSVLPEGLPSEMPSREDVDKGDWEAFHRKHSPSRLLFSFGSWYRWMQIYYNELCQVEVTLNLSPLGDYRPHHSVYLVSQVELDITNWNEVQFTIDIPAKQASLTVSDGSQATSETEIFSLPEDFAWSFQEDWETSPAWSGSPNIHYVDNNMGIYSGSGSGSFAGKLDWVYLANGTLDPTAAASRISALRDSGAVAMESAPIEISPDGYVAAVELSSIDYPEWEAGAFVNSSMRNKLLSDVYAHFEDAFDFVFLVQNEEESDLHYMGMYIGYSNDLKGISEDGQSFDQTRSVGSKGRLKGVIHFPVEWAICCGPSLHELMHYWGNSALEAYTFDVWNVTSAEDILEQIPAGSHWGVSSVDGQLGGFDLNTLEELGNNWYSADPFGTFANGGNSIPYGNFELYLMGLIPPAEVEDLILFKGLRATAGEFFDERKWYAEEKMIVTIDDILEKLGPRVPDHTASQREFRILTLVLTDHGLSDQEWAYFSEQAKGFEDTFSWATGDRARARLGDLDIFERNTAVQQDLGNLLPRDFALEQNFPNPFNPGTTIQYNLPRAGPVSLKIYNIAGQVVRHLVDQPQNAGSWQAVWDGKDEFGAPAANGVYICELRAGEYRAQRKMLLIK